MKYFFAMTLLLSSLSSFAFEIKVNRMSPKPGMDRSFILATKSVPDQVVLDCQSFVQGLTIGKGESASFFMMEPQDCESLYVRTRDSLRKLQKHCIDVDSEVRADYACQ